MEKKLLIMDDDFQRVLNLQSVLSPEIIILHAYDFRHASKLVTQHTLSVAVLKFHALDPAACFQFLTDLRALQPMPILITHTLTEKERIYAYDAGADLCIDAPAHITELAAGIRAVLRRHYNLNRITQILKVGMTIRHKSLVIDPKRRAVTMRGRPVYLSAKEFDVLYFLAQNPGIVLSREQIYEHVWKEEHIYGSRSVADHISAIRKKLGLSPLDKEYIETLYRVGYRFVE